MTSSHSAGAYKERAGGGTWIRCEAQPLLCKACSEDPPVGINWKLVRRRLSGQAPDPVNQNLHLKKLPRGFICTLKLKKRCTKPGSANFLLRAWYARLFSRLHFWSLLPPPTSSSSSSSSSSFTSLQVEPTGLGLHPATGLSSGRVVSETETKVNKSWNSQGEVWASHVS